MRDRTGRLLRAVGGASIAAWKRLPACSVTITGPSAEGFHVAGSTASPKFTSLAIL
jgi:hypothetical protein